MNLQESGGRKPLFNVELLLGISAILLSLAALVVSIFQTNLAREQTRIARQQQHASVWPHVQVRYGQKHDEFTWYLLNNGVGPAIIHSIGLTYQGKSYPSHYAFIAGLIREAEQQANTSLDVQEIHPGFVLKADGELLLAHTKGSLAVANALRQIIEDSTYRFQIRYQDVYGNCWQNERNQAVRLPGCTPVLP
ncbi:MAG: hypothetical protein ICV83_01495 [Cytophagales bacterium]|nr:hypothetical protein [Cytophagales bacterium]